ncbi:MAG: hypothetical protein V2I33_09475 [Kangiellaceae bacterium]|jgi:protein PhnA|nr:hypothetical protein [Kangiellaceae bacterium]
MAKGLQKHQAHQDKLSLLGKDLARRAKSQCELSGQSGVPLTIYEAIESDEPSLNTTCMLCDDSLSDIKRLPKKNNLAANQHWRCLSNSIWSEVPIIQALSYKLLELIDLDWSKDLLEQVYLTEEVEALLPSINFD